MNVENGEWGDADGLSGQGCYLNSHKPITNGNEPMPTQPTCLFTSTDLGPETKEEHTILESLGGRIRSREVSSSEFNGKCGELVDPILADIYRDVFAELSPALPSASKPGKVSLVASDGQGYFVEDGFVKLKGVRITDRDASGQPKTAIGEDVGAVHRLAKSMKKSKADYVVTEQPIAESVLYRGRPIVCKEAEISSLKCVLLTFDHLLRGESSTTRRFTRHESLAPVRAFVRDVVFNGTCSNEELNRYCLGVQLEKQAAYSRILAKVPHVPQPFEHVLIACGNAAQRTVDIAWSVAGIETLGFRLSSDWRDGDFVCVVISQVFAGGNTVGPFWLDICESICKPTDLRSVPGFQMNDDSPVMVPALLSELRMDAFRRAVDYVEMNCDQHVCRALVEKARLKCGGTNDLKAAVMEHLCRLYGPQVRGTADFNEIVLRHAGEWESAWADEEIDSTEAIGKPQLSSALVPYRCCLSELKQRFGLPGHMFRHKQAVDLCYEDRPIGDVPKPDWS